MVVNKIDLNFESIKLQVAEIFEQQLGLPRDRVLAGENFVDLDPAFDSLSLVQVQLFLEEVYETRFQRGPMAQVQTLPANIDELVSLLLPKLLELAEAT